MALVAYFSSVLMMKKCENVNLLAGSLLLCGIINGGVCLLQYLGYPLALQLGVFFCDLENDVQEKKISLQISKKYSTLKSVY